MDMDEKDAVVFLDGNISPNVCFYWKNRRFRDEAHWTSFFSVEGVQRSRENADPRAITSKRMDLGAMNAFFEALGDINLLDPADKTPGRMEDHELLDYMWDLIERRYPQRKLYVFYTQDMSFLRQEKIRLARHLVEFQKKVVIVPIEGLGRDPHSIELCSRAICHDLEKRFSWPCRCYYTYDR